MLKRLIEVALPLKEVSEQSAREKSIRHGHISTLHIWWARRPLAACRAVVFASLIPDPDDPECPVEFRNLVMKLLQADRFRPNNSGGTTVEDTPRNRCLEFIKHLVRWDNLNTAEYLEPAKQLIAAAHHVLNPRAAVGGLPTVLDPFAGGGSIPLESLRLGCRAHALDLNPVAHFIQLCTLVHPQKYGQPQSRSVPDYIKCLIFNNRAKKKKTHERSLFDLNEESIVNPTESVPNVAISEAEYLNNPLRTDVKYWGHWVLEHAQREIGHLYPSSDDDRRPLVYLWARTVPCSNPSCTAIIPLVRDGTLVNRRGKKAVITLVPSKDGELSLFLSTNSDSDSSTGTSATIQRGSVQCPCCNTTEDAAWTRRSMREGKCSHRLLAVVTEDCNQTGKRYRLPAANDFSGIQQAVELAASLRGRRLPNGTTVLPDELLATDEPRRMNVILFGIRTWSELFTDRQLVAIDCFRRHVVLAVQEMATRHNDAEYVEAVGAFLACVLDRLIDKLSSLCIWNQKGENAEHTFGRQALPMVWDYAEVNPFSETSGNWLNHVDWVTRCIESNSFLASPATVGRGDATRLAYDDESFDATITDPPYYDSVCYANLSDFFYVWLKRTLCGRISDQFTAALTPKGAEIIQNLSHKGAKQKKDRAFYEAAMRNAVREMARVTRKDGVVLLMFAHTSTDAWEVMVSAIVESGLFPTASWPIHTERAAGMVKKGKAMLASSIAIVCRQRSGSSQGMWDDVREELACHTRERMDMFWSAGIRGADFFISAIGPALSVFGRHERVLKLSGDVVSAGEFLEAVRTLVTEFALMKILRTKQMGSIDTESRFYVIWKWSYGDVKVPAGEAFVMAQALGIATEQMWDKTGVLEKSGENVQATPVAKRTKLKNLGEPTADGAPSSLIDVLHRMCAFREKGDTEGMAQFLGRSGHGNNDSLWLVAQAVSEILPDGDKEKQLMQGLLNQKEGLEEAARQGRLF